MTDSWCRFIDFNYTKVHLIDAAYHLGNEFVTFPSNIQCHAISGKISSMAIASKPNFSIGEAASFFILNQANSI